MSDERWYVGIPVTWRSGPGHKSHLSRDRKKALCRVEKNARSMSWEPPTFGSVTDAMRYITDHMYARRLCGNCKTLAGRPVEAVKRKKRCKECGGKGWVYLLTVVNPFGVCRVLDDDGRDIKETCGVCRGTGRPVQTATTGEPK